MKPRVTPAAFLCMDCGKPTGGARCQSCAMRENWQHRPRRPRPPKAPAVPWTPERRAAHAQRLRDANPFNTARALELAALHHGGATLQEIGDAIGISRERVRQLIARVAPPKDSIGWRHEDMSALSSMARRALGITREARLEHAAHVIDGWINDIRLLAKRLGRTPTLTDLARLRGYRSPAAVQSNMRSALGAKRYTVAHASHEVFRMAGYHAHGPGCPGISKRVFSAPKMP